MIEIIACPFCGYLNESAHRKSEHVDLEPISITMLVGSTGNIKTDKVTGKPASWDEFIRDRESVEHAHRR